MIVYTPQRLARLRHEGSASRCHFGGDSSSAQTTSNTDARVVGGDSSQNISAALGDGASFTVTDHGAVSDSLALARAGIESVENVASVSIGQAGDMLSGVLQATGQQQAAFTSALKEIETKDTRTLIYAGMAVIGLAAVAMLKGWKG